MEEVDNGSHYSHRKNDILKSDEINPYQVSHYTLVTLAILIY